MALDTNESSQSIERPFYLTGWGIALFSYFSVGIALPFLLWARGPKTKERRKKILVWTAIICGVVLPLPIIGAFIPATSEDANTNTGNGTSRGQTMSMPMILGKSVYDISDKMSELENELNLDIQYADLVGARSIWNKSNWIVVIQAPAADEVLEKGQVVCVGVRKRDETENQHQYRLSDDCPSALGPNTWPPSGFDLVLDGVFALNTEYRSNDPAHLSCTLKKNNQVFISNTGSGEGRQSVGTSGRCNFYEFLSRERCTNVQVLFQWLTSIDTVIGLGTTWVDGSIAPGEKFRVMSFLPNKAWNKALGSHRIYDINCN